MNFIAGNHRKRCRIIRLKCRGAGRFDSDAGLFLERLLRVRFKYPIQPFQHGEGYSSSDQ